MQHIHPFDLLPRKHAGDGRVDHGLHGTVTEGHDKCRHVEHCVSIRKIGEHGGKDMTGKGKDHRVFVAYFIHDQAEQHDAYGKRPEPYSGDLAYLRFRKMECRAPLRQGECAQDESERGGDHSHKACEEKLFIGFFPGRYP